MSIRPALRLALNLSVALIFVWLVVRRIEWEEISAAFSGSALSWLAAAVATFVVGYACRIARWRAMLVRDNPRLQWSNCAGPFLASIAVNNVLPFRAGDVLRSFAFNAELGVSSGVAIATLFVERLLDLLLLLALLGGALFWFGTNISPIAETGGAVLIATATAILVVLVRPQTLTPFASLANSLVCRIFPPLGRQINEEINKGVATLRHLSAGGTLTRLIVWSALTWLAEGGTFWCCALAFPAISTPAAAWLALPVGTLATLIPSTPGYVGTFDYFNVRAMTSAGNALSAATAFALVVHMVIWMPPTLLGGFYLIARRLGRKAQLLTVRP